MWLLLQGWLLRNVLTVLGWLAAAAAPLCSSAQGRPAAIRSIQLRQPLIDGIAPEVVEPLKKRHVPRWRRVRSIEAATGVERHASRSRVGERRSSAPPRTPASLPGEPL
jgi:hypothetical protein